MRGCNHQHRATASRSEAADRSSYADEYRMIGRDSTLLEDMSRIASAYDRDKYNMMNIIVHQNRLLDRLEQASGRTATDYQLVHGSYVDALHRSANRRVSDVYRNY